MGILTEILAPAAGAALSFEGLESAVANAREAGQLGLTESERLGNRAVEQSRFRPFTVSTRTGSVATDDAGGFSTQLDPTQANTASQLFSTGSGMLTSLGNVDQRSQELFDTLSAIRRPEIERQRMGLEERLFNQGRSGVQTNQYGGTPEQLALEKAIQEQMSRDTFTARGQALGEQAQQAQIGQNLLATSYLPEQQLLNFLQPGVAMSDIANTGQRQGAQLQSFLGQSGLQSYLGGEALANQLRQQEIQGLVDLLTSASTPTSGGFVESLDNTLDDFLSDLFNLGN